MFQIYHWKCASRFFEFLIPAYVGVGAIQFVPSFVADYHFPKIMDHIFSCLMTVYPKFEKRTKVIRNTSNKLTKSSRGIWSASTQLSRGELIAMVVPFVFSESEVTFTIPLRRRSFCAQIKSCVESRELKRHMRCDSAFRSDSNR